MAAAGRAYGGPTEPTNKEKAAALGLAALRLVVPVSLVLVLLGAAYLYADDLFSWGPASIRDAGLAVSDLILPGCWYCIHLTNRRYGPGYALAHLLAALAIGLLVILVNPGDIDAWVVTMPAITSRAVLSFGAAFLANEFRRHRLFRRRARGALVDCAAGLVAGHLFCFQRDLLSGGVRRDL